MSADLEITGFTELETQILALNGETGDRITRNALNAAGKIIMPALRDATPIRSTVPGKHDLPAGALRASIRKRIFWNDGLLPKLYIDFGKLTHIARFVDDGHVSAGGKHTPAHPFVRATEDATRQAAADAFIEVAQTEINEVLSKS